MDPLNWTATILLSVLVLILIFLNIFFISSVIKFKQSKEDVDKAVISCSIFGNLCFAISGILAFLTTLMALLHDSFARQNATDLHMTAGSSAFLFYFVAQQSMIFVFVLKIDRTFSNSPLGYNPITIRMLYGSSVLMFLFFVFLLLAMITEMSFFITTFCGFCYILLYIGLFIIVSYLFANKIQILVFEVTKREKSKSSNSIDTPTNSISVDVVVDTLIDESFLFIVIKHAVLVSFAVCSTFILSVAATISLVFDAKRGNGLSAFAVFWGVLDCVIGSFCVLLLFGFGNEIYQKMCSRPHRFCRRHKLDGHKLEELEMSSK